MATTETPVGGEGIKFDNFRNDNGELVGCCSFQDICDRVKDSVTYPYTDDSQTAKYMGVSRESGLANLLGMYLNISSMNDMMDMNRDSRGTTYRGNLNTSMFKGGNGPSVREMPLNAGDQRIRTGFKSFRASRDNEYVFSVTQEMLDLTSGGAPIGTNVNKFILPSFYAIYGSSDASCGSSSKCCGDGAREWFILKKDGSQEKVWVYDGPNDGNTDTSDYGVISNPGQPDDGAVAVFVVRAVGQAATMCDDKYTPSQPGAAVELECGDQIRIGNVVSLNGCGSLPCESIGRKRYKKTEFHNYAQRINDPIMCFSQGENYRNTYLGQNNHLEQQYQEGLDRFAATVSNTILYGQANSFPGEPLNDDIYPGSGDNEDGCNNVPFGTDGVMTLIKKHGRSMTVCVGPECDNRCLIPAFQKLLGMLTKDAEFGSAFLVGDDFAMHYLDDMIRKGVNAQDFKTAAMKILSDPLEAIEGMGMFSYRTFDINGKKIPFVLDMEIKRTEPGVMYLLHLDAIEIWHPNNQLDTRLGFLPSTGRSGSMIPVIHTDEQMVSVNGQNQMISANNCAKNIYASLQFGVWYEPKFLSNSWRIKFQGLDENGMPTDQLPSCGCYGVDQGIYEAVAI